MEKFQDLLAYIKLFGIGTCTFVVGFLGGWDIALKVLVTLTALDILTGLIVGTVLKQLSSSIGYKGFAKKIGMYVMVGVACLLDQMLNTQAIFRSGTIGFYIAIEGISILENWGKIGLPLPNFIKDVLLQLKENSNKGNTNKGMVK